MVTINRKRFYEHYKKQFGSLTQAQVDAVNDLLVLIENDDELNSDTRWVSYALATTKHETAHTFEPITEYGHESYFKKYDAGTAIGKRLGNVVKGDGFRFRGRGFVQVTGRANYTKLTREWNRLHPAEQIDFTKEPDLLLQSRYAWFALSYGMRTGLFTGKKLGDYLNDRKPTDYLNSRRIINGMDKAATIADIANRFERMLKFTIE